MSNSETFCLRLNDFGTNIKTSWKEFQDEEYFYDVTLACDELQIKAHKIIISSCSPVFKNILKHNPNKHPLIYLRGVKYSDLKNLLTFIYQGEVSIAEEDLNRFLTVAEDLKIKGLYEEKNTDINSTRMDSSSKVQKNNYKRKEEDLYKTIMENQDLLEAKTERINNFAVAKSLVPINEEKPFPCTKCDKKFISLSNLNAHMKSLHEGIRYSCDKCEYKATQKVSLKVHIKSIHEGVRYPCGQCQFIGTQRANLYTHVKNVHKV